MTAVYAPGTGETDPKKIIMALQNIASLISIFKRDLVSVKDYGAVGDGVTNDTTAIQNAINFTAASGKGLFFPAGTYLTTTILAVANMRLVGEGPTISIIKLKNATNNFLIWSDGSHEINDVVLLDIGFDGNSANNSFANTITIYGNRPTFVNMSILNAAGTALTTQSDSADGLRNYGTSGFFQNIIIDSAQGAGWNFTGPNDSDFYDIVIIDAGLAADATYWGMLTSSNGNGRFTNFHGWNRSTATNTPINSLLLGTSGNNITNSHFEGGHTPLLITASGNTISNSTYYAPRGTFCVDLQAGANTISGVMGVAAFSGNLSYKGINLRSSNNIIDVSDLGCLNGAIDFSSDTGQNFVRLNGFRATGTATVGTPHTTDDVMIAIGGAAGTTLSQRPKLAWTTYTPTIATNTGTITTLGTVTGRYQLNGAEVSIEIVIPITTNGTGAGNITATLPFTAQSSAVLSGRENAVSGKSLQGFMVNGSTVVTIANYDNTYPGANGASVIVSGVYERS